jgi:malonyl CoA-acyl carrier protein transacylase
VNVFLYPGQGSQHIGMGAGLFDSIEQFVSRESEINSILGYSMRELCLRDPKRQLNSTEYTQPAIFIVNYLHHCKALNEGRPPDIVAGHSLGEYNALVASGALDVIDGLRVVQARGRLMSRVKGGAMAAVIGLTADQIKTALRNADLRAIDIANYNAPFQTVLSGDADEIEAAESVCAAIGMKMFARLPVSAAFHSRYMSDVARDLRAFLRDIPFKEPKIPVMSNVTGRPYPAGSADQVIKTRLVEQVTASVRWVDIIRYLMSSARATSFVELGPGRVLTGLNQQIAEAIAA